eukprot:3681812-Prorocentrum_lima.AAC.1
MLCEDLAMQLLAVASKRVQLFCLVFCGCGWCLVLRGWGFAGAQIGLAFAYFALRFRHIS